MICQRGANGVGKGLFDTAYLDTKLITKHIGHFVDRRVPNLMAWFSRKGYDVGVSDRLADYQPGDIICWSLSGGLTHTGIYVGDGAVFHNIGPKAKLERDFLFNYTIIGHYRLR